ncbi:hypothetical protein CALCODRAFT_495302 [Calocera cornea HHB12733]|uniref:Uncharacterized protein n=1 Tax=Calocera cornea HHB12733 TaxID=1353952 RepID=A0A165GKW3_9BASI|nr:hypothetical protein CALCODRAFT_495302 [Calocera cornea HHB12733]
MSFLPRLLSLPVILALLLFLLAPQGEGKQLSIGRCWTCPAEDSTGAPLDLYSPGPGSDGVDAEAGATDVVGSMEGEELTCFYEDGSVCVYSAFTGTLDMPEAGCPWKARPQPCSSLQRQHKRADTAMIGLAQRNPAPSKRDAAPSKRAPAPSKRAPAPSKRAPAPSKRAPLPSKRADASAGLAARALETLERMERSALGLVHAFKARWSWAVGRTAEAAEVEKREAKGSAAAQVARAVQEREALYAGDD